MIVQPMSSREVAQHMGISLDTFYKNRARYIAEDGMPAPMSTVGRMAWERTGMLVWLSRHHPLRPQAPANDVFAPPVPSTDDDHRARLAAAYGAYAAPIPLDSRRAAARR